MRGLGAYAGRLTLGMAVGAMALVLGACGGSSSSQTPSTSSRDAATASSHEDAGVGVGASASSAHPDAVSVGGRAQRPLRGTGGDEINDDNPGRADSGANTTTARAIAAQNPCTLVSRAEAEAIVGGPIAAPQEAPLGPTCIYQPQGAEATVTLAVEAMDFAKLGSHVHNTTRARVAGHAAYCATYGETTTFVPLGGYRVLDIAAPCGVGLRFAARALPRVAS